MNYFNFCYHSPKKTTKTILAQTEAEWYIFKALLTSKNSLNGKKKGLFTEPSFPVWNSPLYCYIAQIIPSL